MEEPSVDALCASAILAGLKQLPDFEAGMVSVINKAFTHVLDGEEHFDDLEGCEKSVLGIKIEKYFLRHFNLPAKITKKKRERILKENPDAVIFNPRLDTNINGFDVDMKFTSCGYGQWMIPKECVGHWCILVFADFETKSFSLTLAKADAHKLTKGKNQDSKVSFKTRELRQHGITFVTGSFA